MADLELMRRLGVINGVTDVEFEDARGYREGRDEPLVTLESTAPDVDDATIAGLISPDARDFVIAQEVSSRAHYEARLIRPEWPKGDSGITVGIGYDLGYNSEAQVRRHWAGLLSPADIDLMVKACGKRGQTAGGMLAMFNAIRVPWDVALQVFDRSTVPEDGRKVLGAFPNAMDLKGHAFGALFSLVYNRGAGMGDSATGPRKEMREIRDCMQRREFKKVPQLLRNMKRLWEGKASMRGLIVRRDAEALMFERGLEIIAHAAAATQVASLESAAAAEPDIAARDGDGRFWHETPEGAPEFEAANADWDKVKWAKDADSPDYSHLQDPTLAGKSFEFGADELELLIEQNSFAPDRTYHRIVFALRGAELVTAGAQPSTMPKQEDRDSLTLRDARPDHHEFHCTIGVYNTLTRRLSGYMADTVPNRKAVCSYFDSKKAGNMMPTGCYRLEVGWHHESQADHKIPGCLIENGRQKAVMRSTNDHTYDLSDQWEDDRLHGDNLHPATSDRPDKFSSYGCLVVNGSYTPGPNGDREHGTHNAEWGMFRQALGLAKTGTSDHRKEFDVVLLTGLDAAIARDVLTGPSLHDTKLVRKRLGRLRQGSTGERVAKLRRGLNVATVSGGAATTMDHKLAKALADRQRLDFKAGDGIYSPKMEEHYRFGVFDDMAVVASLESVDEGDDTQLHVLRTDGKAQLESLTYEMGLYAAAADHEGQPVQGAALESLGSAQIAFGVNWVKAKGVVVAQELERQLKAYICGGASTAILTHGTQINDQIEKAAARGVVALKAVLVRLLASTTVIIPEATIKTFVDFVLDKMVAPAASATGAAIAGQFKVDPSDMCRNWLSPLSVASLMAPAVAAPTPIETPSSITSVATLASPRREVADLLGRINAVAGGDSGGFSAARGCYGDLRQYLKRNGARLEPEEVEQVLASLCDTDLLNTASATGRADPNQLIDDLAAVTKHGVRTRTARDAATKILSELHELLGDPRLAITPQRAKSALATLQDHRMFDDLTKLADRFLERDPTLLGAISQPYAQGLIDSGRVVAGRDLLQSAVAEGTLSKDELVGVYGSLGRAYKQNYVNHVRSPADASALRDKFGPQLQKAIENYERVYDRAQPGANFWHGINLIALKLREQRDGLRGDDGGETRKLTQDMLAALLKREQSERSSPGYHWLLASIGEAYLALGNVPKAAEFMALYAQDPGTTAFALAGTIRQLEEVWQIRAGAEGAGAILTNLKAALALTDGGSIKLQPDERHTISKAESVEFQPLFESPTADGKYTAFATLKQIVVCGSAVGAVQQLIGELPKTIGTGFLIHGPDFHPRLSADKSYVLTNAHVLWDAAQGGPGLPSALATENAHVAFETDLIDGRRVFYKCARVIWQSAYDQHDATLFELDRKVERIEPLKLASRDTPLIVDTDGSNKGTRLAVVGHPRGGNLAISVRGSLDEMRTTLVDKGSKANNGIIYLHYATPTEGGNSGSPVFEVDTWRVVALHHAGYPKDSPGLKRLSPPDGFNLANEGIWIESIRAAANARIATMPDDPKPPRKGWFS